MFGKLIKIALKIFGVLALLIVITVGGIIGKEFGKAAVSSTQEVEKQAKINEALNKAAQQINATTPTMVDAETRLDKASLGEDARLIYHYTLINVDPQNVDKSWVKTTLRDSVLPSVCSNDKMISSIKFGVNFEYSYSGSNGVYLGSFTANRDSCGFKS
ncbi:hypothetical protein DLH88_24580 [Vibrio parahaemolyticus]|nr:hypothetical protein [Vibrio parahaemolyticus]EGR3154966.1 hypothetical protein [Vibrio parahaemolyticus]EIE1212902.1 hypothetical protein [Vibrio parahaemolyticus]EJC7076578.1 hypothetical protein [Vibrio parahaemolyticus]EKN4540321.1 hypothetical protein [Vibrio parahaemolyticus]